MSKEKAPLPNYSLDDYQNQVVATRQNDHNQDWREVYPELLTAESLEFIGQHGVGLSRIMPKEFDEAVDHIAVAERDTNLDRGLIEEMGDMLWFATSACSYEGRSFKDACAQALESYGIGAGQINDFTDLDAVVMQNAEKIKVLNDFGLSSLELDDEDRYTRVDEDPYYLFLRSGRRLIRSIQQGKSDVSPSAYIKEPVPGLLQSVGEFACVLTYTANDRLGISIGEVARGNIEKLHSRATALPGV